MSKDTILSLASAYKDQLEENVTYYKLELENQSKFYQTEAFSWASTILGQIRAKVSKLECRIVATFWLFGLVCTMPMMSFLALGEWLKSKLKKNENNEAAKMLVPENERKTILITGAPLTKALYMARVMGQAGHKIIIADLDPTGGLCLTRFSKYVTKYVVLEAKTAAEYEEKLVKIWETEKVDWFLPVSHDNLGQEDTEASVRMAADALNVDRQFNSIALNNVELARELEDKLAFMIECQELGLKVPDFRRLYNVPVDLRNFKDQGLFNDGKFFFLKPTTKSLSLTKSLDLTRIPSGDNEFEHYLTNHLTNKSTNVPYLLNEFIVGKEFKANVISKVGQLLVLQVCPKSSNQQSNQVTEHPSIRKWVETFVRVKSLTGMISFDFIVDNDTDEAFCLECKPRLDSSIVSISDKSQMAGLEQVLRSALSGNLNEGQEAFTPRSTKPIFWLYNELGDFLSRKKSLDELVDVLQNGQEATWQSADPLPFVALNAIQMPILLAKAIYEGRSWTKINFGLGKII